MTVTIELNPEVEARILAESQAQGLSVEDYIQQELAGKTPMPEPHGPTTREERLRLWNEWLNSHDYIKAPPLSDEAISRESIYREREDKQL